MNLCRPLLALLLSTNSTSSGFQQAEVRTPKSNFVAPLLTSATPNNEHKDFILPNPQLKPIDVLTICMEALKNDYPTKSLEVCFEFSSDRCRAAVGGTLSEFMQYSADPVFTKVIHCDSYQILKQGPIIPGTQFRGDMQTILIEIQKGTTFQEAINESVKKMEPTSQSSKKRRLSLEERLRQRMKGKEAQNARRDAASAPITIQGDGKHRFLWTLQRERRPPRQDCWLVHEFLYTKNAWEQTI